MSRLSKSLNKKKKKRKKFTKLQREYDEKVCEKLTVDDPTCLLVYKNEIMVCDHGYELEEKIQIMSMTKTIVGYLFTKLLLNKPKIENFKIPVAEGIHITIKTLLNHESGIVEKQPFANIYKSKDWVKFAKENIRIDPKLVGKKNYSNLGYILLGHIYEILTGTKINKVLELEGKCSWNTDKYGNSDTAGGFLVAPRSLLDLAIIITGMIPERYNETLGKYKEISEKNINYMTKNEYGIKKLKDGFYEFQDGYLGQYLVYNKEKNIIAIRLKIPDKKKNRSNDDPNFVGNVIKYFS